MEPFRSIPTFSIRAVAALVFAVSLLALSSSDGGGVTNPHGAAAVEIDLESPADVATDFQPPDTGCAPGSLPAPPEIDATEEEAENMVCVPVVDRTEHAGVPFDPVEPYGRFAPDDGASAGVASDPIPAPGPQVAGTKYLDGTLQVTYSATFRAYVEAYPQYVADELEGYTDLVFMTETNRTDYGVEFIVRYQKNELPAIQIFDWSCEVSGYPCDGPSWFVRSWDLPTVPCWYEPLNDHTGGFVNYVYFRNSTWILEPRNPPLDPPLWRNAVSILNRCTGQYDAVYSHDYAVNQTDCSLPDDGNPDTDEGCGGWAGVAELGGAPELMPPAIAKMGFHNQTLDYDGQSTRLRPWNSYLTDPSTAVPPWTLYHLSANDTWEAGTYLDDDGDDVPNGADADIDGDGTPNGSDITACGIWVGPGYTPERYPYRFPERRDGAYAGTDDDEDGQVDEPLPQALAEDCDGDGFSGLVEEYVFSRGYNLDDQYACAETSTLNDEVNDRWPADFNDSRSVNIADVTALKQYFNQAVPPVPVRYDISPSGSINIADVTALSPVFNTTCSTPP